MKIIIAHPDLGIGGAERLIIDIAQALRRNGHDIQLITNFYDSQRCFTDTKTFKIEVVGSKIPRNLFGYFNALFAYIRFLYLFFYILIFKHECDLLICDQIPIGIPLLKCFNYKILFYCHFPDQLLTERKSFLKKIYRCVIDFLEEITMACADKIIVNSNYTALMVRKTFTHCACFKNKLDVLYPCLPPSVTTQKTETDRSFFEPLKDYMFLSINRYERKKNIQLVIQAFYELKKFLEEACAESSQNRACESFKRKFAPHKLGLVIAGGYDERLSENKQVFHQLNRMASQLGLINGRDIIFLKSVSNEDKNQLLSQCCALCYTPSGEHFGIVPLEASAHGKPVVALDDGGPRETIVNGQTGYLTNTPQDFMQAMARCIGLNLENVCTQTNMSLHAEAENEDWTNLNFEDTVQLDYENLCCPIEIQPDICIEHVRKTFGFDKFCDHLKVIVEEITALKS